MKKIILQYEPIDVSHLMHEMGTNSSGGIVSFIGRALNNSSDKAVIHLEYEAYSEMAHKELSKAADEAVEKWSLDNCMVVHRFGRIEIGETNMIIAVSSPNHNEAFQAAQYLIDIVKKKVPIWKKEFYADGSSWINEKN